MSELQYWLLENPEVIAAAAALLAACAAFAGIALTVWQARSERKYRELLLMPHLELTTRYEYRDKMFGKNLIEIALFNTGLGPAKITEFSIQRDSTGFSSFPEWFEQTNLIPKGHPLYADTYSIGVFAIAHFEIGKIIPPGEQVMLIRYRPEQVNPSEISDTLLEQVLCGFFYHLKRSTLRFAYSSLLDGRTERRTISGEEWGVRLDVSLGIPPN